MKTKLIVILLSLNLIGLRAQLQVTNQSNATTLAESLVGNGVSISNAFLNCPSGASGTFDGTASNIGMDSGIVLCTGLVADLVGPNIDGGTSSDLGGSGDANLSALSGETTNDACVLEFDVTPYGNVLTFNYVFGSEEYLEFVDQFNDAFGLFISGPNPGGGNYNSMNIALIPGTNIPVTINNLNNVDNSQYYIDNTGGVTVGLDGFTAVLQAAIAVVPCQTYHLKLGVADAIDSALDTATFIEAESLETPIINVTASPVPSSYNSSMESCINAEFTFTRGDANTASDLPIVYTFGGTATEGADFINPFPTPLVIPAGQMSVTYQVSFIDDGIAEGSEILSITVESGIICGGVPVVSTAEVEILDQLPIVASPDVTIDLGQSTTISATGVAFTYSWSPTTGLSNPNAPNPVATPTETTTYTCTATIGTCVYQDSVTVFVNAGGCPGTASPIPAFCSSNSGLSVIDLFGNLTDETDDGSWTAAAANPSGGTFNALAGTFDPNGATAGNYTFTYTIPPPSSCGALSENVIFTIHNCQISVQKSADETHTTDTQAVAPGGTAGFWISVSNTGDADLNNIILNDPLSADCNNTIPTLAVGETVNYYCSQSNVTAAFINTINVSATPVVLGSAVSDSDDTWITLANPAISIEKTAADQSDSQTISPGATAQFAITVTNTGDIALENITVSDALSPNCNNTTIALLGVGESTSYTCSANNILSPFTNVASVQATPQGGGFAVSDSDNTQILLNNPAVDIEINNLNGTDILYTVPGATVYFVITVTNTGDVDLNNVYVSDILDNTDCDQNIGNLSVGESYSFNCLTTNVMDGFTNVATVTAYAPGSTLAVNDTDDTQVILATSPAIQVEKTALDGSENQNIAPGGTAHFKIEVTNTGNVSLFNIYVQDTLSIDCYAAFSSLAVGQTVSYICTQENVEASYTNIALATAMPFGGGDAVMDMDATEVTVLQPSINIEKTATDGSDNQNVLAGGTAQFLITLTNSGNMNLSNIVVSDPSCSSCDFTLASLAVGQTYSYTCNKNAVNANFINTAYVSAEPASGGNAVNDNDETAVTVVHPAIAISKTAADGTDTQTIDYGGTANFMITITNNGDVDLQNVNVTDPQCEGCAQFVGNLAAGETVSYTCAQTNVTNDFANIATVSATYGTNKTLTASDDTWVEVLQAAISINKTAVSGSDIQFIDNGETANFSITVTNTGETPLENIEVSDPLSPNCNQSIATLAVGESYAYECALENVTQSFVNMASVEANSPSAIQTVGDEDFTQVIVNDIPPPNCNLTVSYEVSCNVDAQQFTVTFTLNKDNETEFAISSDNGYNGLSGNFLIDGPYAVGTDIHYTISSIVDATCTEKITVAGVSCEGPTAVEFLSFKGEKTPEGNILTWTTASETNSDYFALMRAYDGINFSEINRQKAKGNSQSLQQYAYADKNFVAGKNYYRVDEYDANGKIQSTQVVMIHNTNISDQLLQIVPVPARENIISYFTSANAQQVTISVFDVSGRQQSTQTTSAQIGNNSFSISISDLPTGVYLLQIKTAQNIFTRKFIKE
ncbi:MAG: choice-of-anchor L domain-containing protein [Chitinophagales bacterium]|nr:choice-of-anchor L domain-containing protein [Bacteroidota bacterium]MCB9043521.1 choice-of-anchor L domain-containing protein [Chitinophagales bacterium]